MPEPKWDPLFGMPAVDHPPLTEIGVILAGLPVDRLLAGLGVAGDRTGPDADPVTATLLVDLLRHGDGTAMADAADTGARRWLAARPALAAIDAAPSMSASVRQSWQRALRTVLAAELPAAAGTGPATHAYLTACWLRRAEVDAAVQELPNTARSTATRA